MYDTLKMKHIWENQGGKNNLKHINTVIKNLRYIYQFHWSNELNRSDITGKPGNKLRTYALFKKIFEYENYLDFHTDFRKRRLVTKLRISAHKLEIEAGRYQGKATTKRKKPEKRLCKLCDLKEIEDEKHVLMSCQNYSTIRRETFESLNNIFPGLPEVHVCEAEKFIFLIQCKDYELFSHVVVMLEGIEKIRGCI